MMYNDPMFDSFDSLIPRPVQRQVFIACRVFSEISQYILIFLVDTNLTFNFFLV